MGLKSFLFARDGTCGIIIPSEFTKRLRGIRRAESKKEEPILNNENVQDILNRLKNLVHEGNVRRVLVKHNGETIVNVPLTAGVVGGALALKAPLLLAATAVAAFGFGCTVELVKDDGDVIVTDFTEED